MPQKRKPEEITIKELGKIAAAMLKSEYKIDAYLLTNIELANLSSMIQAVMFSRGTVQLPLDELFNVPLG